MSCFKLCLALRRFFRKNDISTKISFFSIILSFSALVITIYFSNKTLEYQAEANNIQSRYSEFERNAKIAELLSEYHNIIHQKIDFKSGGKDIVDKVFERNQNALIKLNSLYMITKGQPEWEYQIKLQSEFPLKSLIRRKKKLRCSYWSPEFTQFILTDTFEGIDSCSICSDVFCGN